MVSCRKHPRRSGAVPSFSANMISSLLPLLLLVALTGNSVSALSISGSNNSSNKKGNKRRLTTTTTSKLLVPDSVGVGKKKKKKNQNVLSQQRRQESLDAGHHPLLSLNLNLDALARAQAAERAQELYHRISALHVEGYYAVAPDVVSFNSVLKAWQSDPVQALEFWKTASAGQGLQLNVRSYNTLILSLAKAGLFDQALLVLRQMQETAANSSSFSAMIILPDRITYNTVLLAAAVSRDTAAAEAAEGLLREMMESEYLQPDTISYNTVIDAWSNLAEPERAEYWLQQLIASSASSSSPSSSSRRKTGEKVRPDVYSFTTVIQAWAVTGGPKACLRAWDILQDMLQEKNDDAQPVDALQLQGPNKLLRDMLDDGAPPSDALQLRPNKVTYTVVMHALCRNGELTKAQSLLEDMLDQADRRPEARPDVVTFSVLLDGWAAIAGDHPEEALRAVGTLLRRMNELSEEWPDTAPTAQTYTSVLSAYAHSRQYQAADQALDVLQIMSDAGIEPTVIHYNAALDCCAKSPRADKVDVAVDIWKTMRETGVECDGITWNSLLSVSAGGFGAPANRQRSLQLALHVWSILQQQQREKDGEEDGNYISDPPTSLTFYYFFKTIRKFMESSPARWKLTVNAFESCCQHGCLNEIVLDLVLQHLIPSPEQGRALLKEYWLDTNDSAVLIADLPKEWTRRAMRNRRRRREPNAQ
jgi:pentatricopeptide repeat protein